jgi:hypothetical protein
MGEEVEQEKKTPPAGEAVTVQVLVTCSCASFEHGSI